MTIYEKRADARKMCERLESICNLSGLQPYKVINNRENEEVLVYNEIYDGIQYKNFEMALKYPQYSYFVNNFVYLFRDITLESIDVSKLDTSNVINMHGAFAFNLHLKEIKGLEKWDTSKVKKPILCF